MRKRNGIVCVLLLVFVISCSTDRQSNNDLPGIDVTKNYPEKEINLTDIANVSYVQLSANSDDFLYKGSIDYVTKNTVIVVDRTSHSVLFFSKDGSPKSRFNRRGQGPEEYANAATVMYDEVRDDLYVMPDFNNYINVYSSSGEFKRKLILPQSNILNQLAFFDDQSILVYDNSRLWQNIVQSQSGDKTGFTEQTNDSTFFLISKTDGTVLEYLHVPGNTIDLSCNIEGAGFAQVGYSRVRKSPNGLLLYNPETDTIFLYDKDKSLSPFMHKTPLLTDMNPMIVMDNCLDAGDFQFLSAYTYSVGKHPSATYYMRDKQSGDIFRQKVVLADYEGKDFHIDPRLPNYYEKGYHFELDIFELKEAYGENRLSGKLKELVATLNDTEDNNVFVFVDFK